MGTTYVAKGTTNLTGTYGALAGGDSLIFSEGGQVLNAGTDLSAFVSALVLVFVEPRCTVSVDPAAAMKANITTFVYAAGGGSWYIQPAGAANVITTLTHIGRGGMYLVAGGTVTNYEQATGYGRIADVVACTNLRMSGGTCDQLYSATPNTLWHIDGAILNTGRGVTGTSYIMGGAEVTVAREDTGATLPTGGTIVVGDGLLKWRGGNCTSVILGSRGRLDLSDAPNAATIAVTGTAKALARSKLASKYVSLTVTVTEIVGTRASLYSLPPEQ